MNKIGKIQLASVDQCTGCSACASVCPTKSISMREDKEGFLQPYIDADTCIGCHKCEKTCPIVKPIEIPMIYETQAFAAINKDEEVRKRSSSGGMFYALAKWTIEHGGVVFGARFDEKWDVVHDYTETIEGIEPFMRSKYVQSRIGETYKQAKEFLKVGRIVLFVGTPCQIGGLHAYLGKKYENLIMVDFICHGVPSPGVWRKYLKEKVNGEQVLAVNFRDKQDGRKEFHCVTTTTTYRERQSDNLFFYGFLQNVYLRKSCYNCQFKQMHRLSDVTMADYWGVEFNCPEMDDNKGTSAVFIHTVKGEKILQHLSSDVIFNRQDISDVVEFNVMLTQSVKVTPKRKIFFGLFPFLSFNKLRYLINYNGIVKRIVRKIKKIFR